MKNRTHPRLRGREVRNTGINCPLCAKGDNRSVGGNVPTLRVLADGTDDRPFCLGQHGYITAGEMS